MDCAREANLSASSGYDGKYMKQRKSKNTFSVKTRENDEPSSLCCYSSHFANVKSIVCFVAFWGRGREQKKNVNANERKSNSPIAPAFHAFVQCHSTWTPFTHSMPSAARQTVAAVQ